jgi:hypothetical protein
VGNATPSGVTVTWQSPCWYPCGSNDRTCQPGQLFQAMPFSLQTPSPIPLEATLYYNRTCDPSDGTDNLNDTGGTVGSGGWLYWFIHHPNQVPSSAVWWLGHSSSGCVDYTNAPHCQ